MTEQNYSVLLVTRKEEKYKLINKCIEKLGNEFTLTDLLSIESFTWDEKKELKSIFGGQYSDISGQDFFFEKQDGKWINKNTDYKHRFTTKILNSFWNSQTYSIGSEVYPGDLKLIEMLLH